MPVPAKKKINHPALSTKGIDALGGTAASTSSSKVV